MVFGKRRERERERELDPRQNRHSLHSQVAISAHCKSDMNRRETAVTEYLEERREAKYQRQKRGCRSPHKKKPFSALERALAQKGLKGESELVTRRLVAQSPRLSILRERCHTGIKQRSLSCCFISLLPSGRKKLRWRRLRSLLKGEGRRRDEVPIKIFLHMTRTRQRGGSQTVASRIYHLICRSS